MLKSLALHHTNLTSVDPSSFPVAPAFLKLLAAFFAKTPLPRRHCLPFRFRVNRFMQNCYHQDFSSPHTRRFSQNANMRHLPTPLSEKSRPRLLCFVCRSSHHLVRTCPKREEYKNKLQAYIHLGGAATYLLSHESTELSGEEHRVLQFFDDSENSILDSSSDSGAKDEDDIHFSKWLADLLDTYDPCTDYITTQPALYSSTYSSTHFATFSVLESAQALCTMMNDLILHADTYDTQFLLHTGAPKTICNESWLAKLFWKPIKGVHLPDHLPSFCFAGPTSEYLIKQKPPEQF